MRSDSSLQVWLTSSHTMRLKSAMLCIALCSSPMTWIEELHLSLQLELRALQRGALQNI